MSSELTALTALTSPAASDLAYVLKDPAGSPTNTKGTLADLLSINKLGARVHRTTTQSINNATPTAISFDAERYDHGGFWVVGSPTRLTVPSGLGGLYLVTLNVSWAANATGIRAAGILLNGATIIGNQTGPNLGAVVEPDINVATVYTLAAADYVELRVYQDSGGARNIQVNANWSPEFAIQLLART